MERRRRRQTRSSVLTRGDTGCSAKSSIVTRSCCSGCADWSWDDRVRRSLEAGHEWLLVCQTPEGWSACSEAAARLPEPLWAAALAATRSMRRHLPKAPHFDAQAWTDWVLRVQASAKETA